MLKRVLLITLMFILPAEVFLGRDIDLDSVYISDTSDIYAKLINQKLDAYEKADSRPIASDVVFANWINGNEILYVRDFQSVSVIYVYSKDTGKSKEVYRIQGAAITMIIDADGAYAHIKYLQLTDASPVPENHLLTISLRTYKTKDRRTNNMFMDFSLPAEGSSIIFESRQGISEEFTDTGLVRLLVPASSYYKQIKGKGNPTIALFSPSRGNCLLMNGSGGIYKTLMLNGGSIKGVTSPTETFWLNNNTLMFRTGYTGNYGVAVEQLGGKRRTLAAGSLNTNICLSRKAGMAAFLNSQLIIMYNIKTNAMINTGLEGEDVYFSPDAAFCISLLQGNLFLTRYKTLLERKAQIAKVAATILNLYKEAAAGGDLLNDYSKTYCAQKIKAYQTFIDGK